MKKGMFVRSLFLVVGLMFFILVSIGGVAGYQCGYLSNVKVLFGGNCYFCSYYIYPSGTCTSVTCSGSVVKSNDGLVLDCNTIDGGGCYVYGNVLCGCSLQDSWTDTSSCGGCTPTCGAACTGTKTQKNVACGLPLTRTVSCTVPAIPYGSWSCSAPVCSTSCGTGTVSRTVSCSTSCCNPNIKPVCGAYQCTDYSGCTYSWKTGGWTPSTCSECEGTQTRSVWCQRSDGATVADSSCSGTKPATSQACGGAHTASCTATFGTCSVTGTKTCSSGSYGSCAATDPRTATCVACAPNTCQGSTCSNGCGGTCPGTKVASCVSPSTVCNGVAISSTSGCGTCPSGTKDCTAPTLSASNSENTWYNSQRAATVSASDTGGSNLVAVNYKWGSALNAGCTDGTSTSNGAILNAPAGGTTLYMCARDGAGNKVTWNGVYNWENPQLCGGTAPIESNFIQGPITYLHGYTPTSWQYNESATTSTSCKWKCNEGYIHSGNRCVKCTSGDCCNVSTGNFLSDVTICNITSPPYCISSGSWQINVTKCSGNAANCPSTPVVFDTHSCISPTPFCSEGSCTKIGITDAYWALLNGTRVVNADVNDTVLMVVNGNGLSGKSINYSVCKLGFGGTCWWWTTKENIEEVFGSAPYAVSDAGLYEFTAKVEGFQKTSETLQSYGGRPIDNAHPFTRIILPINELNVSVGEKINFNVSSHDEDDLLKITWDFGDGTTKVITNYVNNPLLAGNSNYNTSAAVTHNYSSSGRYLIKLTAKEMERDQEDSKETYINVFNTGINVFPVISSPIGVINNRTINFNASRSFVANCSTASCPSCPIQIEGGKLNCSYIHKSGNKSVGNYDLNIAWTIEDSPDIKINGSWSLNYSGVVDFLKYLEKSDNRKVELIMKYIPASGAIIPGETSNYFSINEWYCDTSTITGTWRRPGFSSISNNCSKYASLNDGLACCPSYQQCNQNGSCSGNVKYCSQFADWACNTGTPQIVFMNNKNYTCKESIGPDVNHCTTTNICHCILNLTATTHCQDVFSIVKSGAGCTGGGDCTYSSEIQDNCNNTLNNRIVTKIAHWTPVAGETGINPDCQSIVTTEICPVTAKLPFFGNFMMFMSIFFIIVIYLFRIKKKQF